MIDIEKQAAVIAYPLTRGELSQLVGALNAIRRERDVAKPPRLPEYVVRVPRMQQVVTPVPAAELVAMSVRGD